MDWLGLVKRRKMLAFFFIFLRNSLRVYVEVAGSISMSLSHYEFPSHDYAIYTEHVSFVFGLLPRGSWLTTTPRVLGVGWGWGKWGTRHEGRNNTQYFVPWILFSSGEGMGMLDGATGC